MKKVITSTQVLSELCKARKDISQLRLLLETVIQNQHKILRIIDPPQKLPVQDGDKTFEEMWNVSPFKKAEDDLAEKLNKLVVEDVFIGILKTFNPNK